jgi:hypothetical protein
MCGVAMDVGIWAFGPDSWVRLSAGTHELPQHPAPERQHLDRREGPDQIQHGRQADALPLTGLAAYDDAAPVIRAGDSAAPAFQDAWRSFGEQSVSGSAAAVPV